MANFNGFDIFGVPLEYASESTRKIRWPGYIHKISQLLKIEISRTFQNSIYDIYQCVFLGYLSFQSASYFLLGRFTPLQDSYLRVFNDFLKNNSQFNKSKIQALWQGQKSVAPANTFLFPLVEQDSNVLAMYDFTKERESYESAGEALRKEIEQKLFVDSFDDLPPDDACMP